MEMIDAKLRLGPPGGSDVVVAVQPARKRSSAVVRSEASGSTDIDHDAAPASRAQVVGWPPVRASYRKNAFHHAAAEAKACKGERKQGGLYVKVGMDGAPYLRKVDLRTCGGYRELRDVLDALFGCFSSSSAADGAQFAFAYEDKDGDLMLLLLLGVVPDEVIKEAAIYSKLLLDAMRMERNGHDSHEGDRWIDARRATDHRICMEGSLGNRGPPGQAPRCTLFYPRIRTWR